MTSFFLTAIGGNKTNARQTEDYYATEPAAADLLIAAEPWLIGMFARTPKAAAFRKWVITALAEHVDGMSANGQTALPPPAETKEEKIARKITMLMMAECQIIKSDWFSELTAELEQAKKTIKEQQETMQKISSFLPPTK